MTSMDNIDKSQTAHPGGANASAHVTDRTSLVLCIIALITAAVALGSSLAQAIMLPHFYDARSDGIDDKIEAYAVQARVTEREKRVEQERWADLKIELVKRGIPVSDH